jgi:hypothetical protein
MFSSITFGKTYEVLDIIKSNPYINCMGCFVINLFDIGIVPGSKIKVKNYISGVWLVEVLDGINNESSVLGIRDEKNYKILVK